MTDKIILCPHCGHISDTKMRFFAYLLANLALYVAGAPFVSAVNVGDKIPSVNVHSGVSERLRSI